MVRSHEVASRTMRPSVAPQSMASRRLHRQRMPKWRLPKVIGSRNHIPNTWRGLSIFATRKPAIQGKIVESRPLAAPDVDIRSKDKRRAETGINVPCAECLLQRCKARLAGAVTGSNILNFELVLERAHDLLNGIIGGHDKVKASGNQMNFRIDGRRGLHNSLNSRMRTADNEKQSIRRVHSEG